MGDALTYGIEIAVGLACLVAASAMRRTSGRRWLAGLLVVAGAAAVLHGVFELAS